MYCIEIFWFLIPGQGRGKHAAGKREEQRRWQTWNRQPERIQGLQFNKKNLEIHGNTSVEFTFSLVAPTKPLQILQDEAIAAKSSVPRSGMGWIGVDWH